MSDVSSHSLLQSDGSSNAGGGGERVLWSALAHIQRTQPEVIILVYSGDYPTASKEDILNKVKVSRQQL